MHNIKTLAAVIIMIGTFSITGSTSLFAAELTWEEYKQMKDRIIDRAEKEEKEKMKNITIKDNTEDK